MGDPALPGRYAAQLDLVCLSRVKRYFKVGIHNPCFGFHRLGMPSTVFGPVCSEDSALYGDLLFLRQLWPWTEKPARRHSLAPFYGFAFCVYPHKLCSMNSVEPL